PYRDTYHASVVVKYNSKKVNYNRLRDIPTNGRKTANPTVKVDRGRVRWFQPGVPRKKPGLAAGFFVRGAVPLNSRRSMPTAHGGPRASVPRGSRPECVPPHAAAGRIPHPLPPRLPATRPAPCPAPRGAG